jgi:hypothetical protein
MSSPTVHVVLIGDLDPLAVHSDALAQVIERQLHRRADGVLLTVEFRTTQSADDPRARSRWLPVRDGDWVDRADVVLDSRSVQSPFSPTPEAPVTVVSLSGAAALFPEQVSAAAIETRQLMLDHLGIDTTTTDFALSATDHLALGSLMLEPLGDADRYRLAAEFDRAGAEINAVNPTSRVHNEALRLEIIRLRNELAACERSRAKTEAAGTERLEHAERRISELTERLEAAVLTTGHP